MGCTYKYKNETYTASTLRNVVSPSTSSRFVFSKKAEVNNLWKNAVNKTNTGATSFFESSEAETFTAFSGVSIDTEESDMVKELRARVKRRLGNYNSKEEAGLVGYIDSVVPIANSMRDVTVSCKTSAGVQVAQDVDCIYEDESGITAIVVDYNDLSKSNSGESYTDVIKAKSYLTKAMLASTGYPYDKIRVRVLTVNVGQNGSVDYGNLVNTLVQKSPTDNIVIENAIKNIIPVATSHVNIDTAISDRVLNNLLTIWPDTNIAKDSHYIDLMTIASNTWKYCSPTLIPGTGWSLTLPGGKKITIKGSGEGSSNTEFVNYIRDNITEFTSAITTRDLTTNIKESFRAGYLKDSAGGENVNKAISKVLMPYWESRADWEIVEDPILSSSGILFFRNKKTGVTDVVVTSTLALHSVINVNERTNILGRYLPDVNSSDYNYKSTGANLETIRFCAYLNEMADITTNMTFRNINVVSTSQTEDSLAVIAVADALNMWHHTTKTCSEVSGSTIENKLSGISVMTALESLRKPWYDFINGTQPDDPLRRELKVLSSIFNPDANADSNQYIIESVMKSMIDYANRNAIGTNDLEKVVQASKDITDPYNKFYNLLVEVLNLYNRYNGNVDTNLEELSSLEAILLPTQNISNDVVNQATSMVLDSLDQVREKVINKTRTLESLFKNYYRAKAHIGSVSAGTVSRVYDNLFILDEAGNNTFMFKNPYDSLNDLDEIDRNFLKEYLFEQYKLTCAVNGIKNPYKTIDDIDTSKLPANYLFVPLTEASHQTMMSHPSKYLSSVWTQAKQAVTSPSRMVGWLNNVYGENPKNRKAMRSAFTVYNPFYQSMVSTEKRNRILASENTDRFETNLENIFFDFNRYCTQTEIFRKLLMKERALQMSVLMKGDRDGVDTAKKINKYIDDYLATAVYRESLESDTMQKVGAVLSPFRNLMSTIFIALSPSAFIRDMTQGLLVNFTESITNQFSDISPADVAKGYKLVMEDSVKSIKTSSLFEVLNRMYGFSTIDASDVLNAEKTDYKGLTNTGRWLYSTLRTPDYVNRMVLLASKLTKDGVMDALSVENHKLKYDWKKDKRFSVLASGDSNNPEYSKQLSLYLSTARALVKQGTMKSINDDLPTPYTNDTWNSFKTAGNMWYGYYDRATKAKYEFLSIGRHMAVYSTWFNGLCSTYFGKKRLTRNSLRLEQSRDENGNLLYFDENRNVTTKETNIPVLTEMPIATQGVLWTFADIGRQIFKEHKPVAEVLCKDNLTEVDKANIRRVFGDILIFSLMYALFKGFFGSDGIDDLYKGYTKNNDSNSLVSNILVDYLYHGTASSYDAFMGPAAIVTYLGNSTTLGTYKVQSFIGSNTYNWLFGNDSFSDMAMKSFALTRCIRKSINKSLKDDE